MFHCPGQVTGQAQHDNGMAKWRSSKSPVNRDLNCIFSKLQGGRGWVKIRYQLCCRLRSPCGCFQQLSVRKLRCTVRVHCSRTRLKWDDGVGYTDKTCSHTFHFKMVARLICIINMLLIFPNCSDTGWWEEIRKPNLPSARIYLNIIRDTSVIILNCSQLFHIKRKYFI